MPLKCLFEQTNLGSDFGMKVHVRQVRTLRRKGKKANQMKEIGQNNCPMYIQQNVSLKSLGPDGKRPTP